MVGEGHVGPVVGERQSVCSEMDLLVACARQNVSGDQTAEVGRLASSVLDWDLVLELADRHKVLPLLQHTLSSADLPNVPPFVLQSLRQSWGTNAERNLLLSGELVRVLAALDSSGVQAIPYRGPVLAKRAYRDIRLRQFNDLDVLVHRRDVQRATACLLSLSYQEWDSGGAHPAVRDQSMHHRVFTPNEGRALLELHWQITPRYFGFALDAGAWVRLDSIELAGVAVPILSAEDLLMVLCVHGALHGWRRLAWICDVARLVATQPETDWQLAIELADRQGATRTLHLGLLLAYDLLRAPLPRNILDSVWQDGVARGLAAQVTQWLPEAAEAHSGPQARYPLTRLHLGLREGWAQKAAFLLRAAFVPSHEDWAAVRLSPRLSFLYYLVRPLRLLSKHARRTLRRSRA